MKKIMSILLVITILVSLTGCVLSPDVKDGERFKEEYEKENGKKSKSGKENRTVLIDEDNPFVYTTAEEISKKMDNNETFIVYFGFSTCPWCRSIIEQLIKCAKDNNIDKIYYVDVLNIRDTKEIDEDGNIQNAKKGSKGYLELIDKMKNVLSDYTLTNSDGDEISLEEKRIYAPNVVAVVDGEATKMEEGISEDLKDPYQKLTDKMKKETYNKFKCLFQCLKEAESMCTKKSC